MRPIIAIAKVTFKEVIQDRLLYGSLICAVFLLGFSFLAAGLSFARPERILLDFGLTAVSLSSVLIAILVGAPMIGREFERRTIHVVLSKPVSRFQFLCGKYLGLIFVICANWVLLGAFFLVILKVGGGEIHSTLLIALFYVLFQSALAGIIAIFISSFSTTTLAVILTFAAFIIGNNISQIRMLAIRTESEVFREVLMGVSYAFPNFEYFNLEQKVTYGLPVTPMLVLISTAYGLVIIAFVLGLAGVVIQRKEG